MLPAFTEKETMDIGRAMSQSQEGIVALNGYLERAVVVIMMHAMNTDGTQSEKFKGAALVIGEIRDELILSVDRAEGLIDGPSVKKFPY